ncbi:uncharacterized protein LOC125742682 isoform X2 [Brienomyrus brachyistius]|uniref:uncharacterized protein LOC125742682 isoform X2 n=1 Tax=Brienomyrus brachyistius TaxID=42636 RepID=UPI0020B191F9|nr:uncharacterized protein LOC125742682 isoform X2 [Brienomyrus brachyistius]
MKDFVLSLLSRGCGQMVQVEEDSFGGRIEVCLEPEDYFNWKSQQALLRLSHSGHVWTGGDPAPPKTYSTRRGPLILYSEDLALSPLRPDDASTKAPESGHPQHGAERQVPPQWHLADPIVAYGRKQIRRSYVSGDVPPLLSTLPSRLALPRCRTKHSLAPLNPICKPKVMTSDSELSPGPTDNCAPAHPRKEAETFSTPSACPTSGHLPPVSEGGAPCLGDKKSLLSSTENEAFQLSSPENQRKAENLKTFSFRVIMGTPGSRMSPIPETQENFGSTVDGKEAQMARRVLGCPGRIGAGGICSTAAPPAVREAACPLRTASVDYSWECSPVSHITYYGGHMGGARARGNLRLRKADPPDRWDEAVPDPAFSNIRLPPVPVGPLVASDQFRNTDVFEPVARQEPRTCDISTAVPAHAHLERQVHRKLLLPVLIPVHRERQNVLEFHGGLWGDSVADKQRDEPSKQTGRDECDVCNTSGVGPSAAKIAPMLHCNRRNPAGFTAVEPAEDEGPPLGVLPPLAGRRGPGKQSSMAFHKHSSNDGHDLLDPHDPENEVVRGSLPVALKEWVHSGTTGAWVMGPDGEIIRLSIWDPATDVQEPQLLDNIIREQALSALASDAVLQEPWAIILQPDPAEAGFIDTTLRFTSPSHPRNRMTDREDDLDVQREAVKSHAVEADREVAVQGAGKGFAHKIQEQQRVCAQGHSTGEHGRSTIPSHSLPVEEQGTSYFSGQRDPRSIAASNHLPEEQGQRTVSLNGQQFDEQKHKTGIADGHPFKEQEQKIIADTTAYIRNQLSGPDRSASFNTTMPLSVLQVEEEEDLSEEGTQGHVEQGNSLVVSPTEKFHHISHPGLKPTSSNNSTVGLHSSMRTSRTTAGALRAGWTEEPKQTNTSADVDKAEIGGQQEETKYTKRKQELMEERLRKKSAARVPMGDQTSKKANPKGQRLQKSSSSEAGMVVNQRKKKMKSQEEFVVGKPRESSMKTDKAERTLHLKKKLKASTLNKVAKDRDLGAEEWAESRMTLDSLCDRDCTSDEDECQLHGSVSHSSVEGASLGTPSTSRTDHQEDTAPHCQGAASHDYLQTSVDTMVTEDQAQLLSRKASSSMDDTNGKLASCVEQQRAGPVERAERRRMEVERKRKEKQEEKQRQQEREEREERMRLELETEQQQRAEALRLKRLKEQEERQKLEEAQRERVRRKQAEKEVEKRRQEEERRQLQRLLRIRREEQERRAAELESQCAAEEAQREEERRKLQDMEENERREYLHRQLEEEEQKQKAEEKRKRKQEEETQQAIEQARLQAEIFARQCEALEKQMQSRRALLLESEALGLTQDISRPWVYSYFTLMDALGLTAPPTAPEELARDSTAHSPTEE